MTTLATDITILLDRTGSMQKIREDTIGGYNAFVAEQQRERGACTLTLVQFDSQDAFEQVYHGPVQQAPHLTHETFVPRAMTPLLDAIGRGINATGARLSALPEADRPGQVVFVIITDGLENASHEFKKATIMEMVTRQQQVYNWKFVFLGANMDAIAEAATLGIDARQTLGFAADGQGIREAYKTASRLTSSYRVGEDAAVTDADREQQKR
jgi:hypothetical protein